MDTIEERIARWYDYCAAYGIKIDKIVVHPDDLSAAPSSYKGLRVVGLGQQR